jgi:hypothetical protein
MENIPFSDRFFLWLFLNHNHGKILLYKNCCKERLGHGPVAPYALKESPLPLPSAPKRKKKRKEKRSMQPCCCDCDKKQ